MTKPTSHTTACKSRWTLHRWVDLGGWLGGGVMSYLAAHYNGGYLWCAVFAFAAGVAARRFVDEDPAK
jgi:hypothetical protein